MRIIFTTDIVDSKGHVFAKAGDAGELVNRSDSYGLVNFDRQAFFVTHDEYTIHY